MKHQKTGILSGDKKLKENPFSVPEGYFENLSPRIMSRIESEKNNPAHRRSHWFTLRSQIALAASIIGFALISYVAIKMILPGETNNTGYLDVALLDEMNVIPEDAYIIDLMPIEDGELSEEDIWINEAVDYLASSDIEMDLFIEQY